MVLRGDRGATHFGTQDLTKGSAERTNDPEGGSRRAAVVHDFARPLHLEEVPKPEPERGEVVVKIEVS